MTEAAFAGMGMALLRRSFIAPALTQGRLVNPLAQPIACPLAYHLVYHETALLAPANRCFRDWLLGQRRPLLRSARSEGALSDKDPYA
ncbi:LysR family transcriptional regulator [Klebsiella pneumoniae]|nr:LysR family transcriptional regulator [Klebsiella pneumoniae]